MAAGVVDLFRARGLRIFGPTQAAAQLESSKAFSKAFMQRHKIPTARSQTFADLAPAHAYVDAEGAPRPILKIYVRPWLRAVAGTASSFHWDATTRVATR